MRVRESRKRAVLAKRRDGHVGVFSQLEHFSDARNLSKEVGFYFWISKRRFPTSGIYLFPI